MDRPPQEPRSSAWPLAIVLVTTALVYSAVCTHEFVAWDDTHNLVKNERMNPPTLPNVGWYWAHPFGHLYIPVTYTVWSALAAVAQTQSPASASELNSYIFHTVDFSQF